MTRLSTFKRINDVTFNGALLLVNVVHDGRKDGRFYFSHLGSAVLFADKFVQPTQTPSQSWVEVVFYVIVCPFIREFDTCLRSTLTLISTCSPIDGGFRTACSTTPPSMASCSLTGSSDYTSALCIAYRFATLSGIVILIFQRYWSSPILQTIRQGLWWQGLPKVEKRTYLNGPRSSIHSAYYN